MASASRAEPLVRWPGVAVLALMGSALLVTAWTTYAAVEDASATLLRGQADAFQQAIRSHLLSLGEPPTSADLAALLEEEAQGGLRYIALLERGGPVAEAGTALGAPLLPPWGPPPEEPTRVGERVRVVFGALSRRPARGEHGPRRGRPGLIVIEFQPLQAEALRAAATRTFGIGALAATTLLLIGLMLVRRELRREALERQRERERRLASLGEMSAVLAHEIRNPLASLKGNAQLLAQSLPEGDRQRPRAARVVDEALRLEALTNDLLEYVRSGEARREPVDPAALLRESAASVHPSLIEVDDRGAPRAWPLDAARMRQVLVNLLENALQAGAPVHASVCSRAAALVFEVRDTGAGVPPEERERIFEPFYTRRTRGTGLGLAVARRVVDLHGGTLSVEDAPGGGALFRVVLPPG